MQFKRFSSCAPLDIGEQLKVSGLGEGGATNNELMCFSDTYCIIPKMFYVI